MALLTTRVTENESEIYTLAKKLSKQDQEIIDLNTLLAQKDDKIASLSIKLTKRTEKITEVSNKYAIPFINIFLIIRLDYEPQTIILPSYNQSQQCQ